MLSWNSSAFFNLIQTSIFLFFFSKKMDFRSSYAAFIVTTMAACPHSAILSTMSSFLCQKVMSVVIYFSVQTEVLTTKNYQCTYVIIF
jgi:hypothetical protein